MNNLKIETCCPRDVTIVSNEFLDHYMPRANGEFVKIYLYLLRAAERPDEALTLGSVADRFNCTENDVIRALRFWEREKIVALSYDASGQKLTGVHILTLCTKEQRQAIESKSSHVSDETPAEPTAAPDYGETAISPERKLELQENEDIRELLFIASKYLGKMLSPSETDKLMYFYEDLHFTTDLIDFLIEYCVSHGHKSMRYIEKVAFNWHASGITTVRAARASVNSFHKDYFAIFKALGITSHNPIDAEVDIMKKWIEDYGFSMDIIREACTRTVLNADKPSLHYADGILSRWNDEGIKTLDDIRTLDLTHEKRSKISADKKSSKAVSAKFNHFEQRTYSDAELEAKLLKGTS